MDMSKYIGEATAYDKKLMLERKEPHERLWGSLPSRHKRMNCALGILRAEYFARVHGLSVRGVEYSIGTLKKAKRNKKVGGKRFGHWEVIG